MTMVSDSIIGEKVNLYTRFLKAADRFPDQIAFKADGGKGMSYTYAEVRELVQKLAGLLVTPAFTNCKEIGLISENRPEWAITYLAITASGKTVVPIDANLKKNEFEYIFDHSSLKTIFTSVRFESYLQDNFGHLKLFSFNEASPHYWKNHINNNESLESSDARENDVASLIYTSGTTGDPKAVELTHLNIIANIDAIQKSFHFSEKDTMLSILPLHHTFEATCGFLTPITHGCTIVFARSLKSKEIAEDIANNHVTIMIGVPLLFEKMYHTIVRKINSAPVPKKVLFKTLYTASKAGWSVGLKPGKKLFRSFREKGKLDSIRLFVSGGAAMPPHITAFYNHIGFDFFQGYGMTECAPVISANRPDNIVFGSVGAPLDKVEVLIENPDVNGIGEIIVRGPNVTPGYRNNPEETAKLIRDGWLYTGDLGKMEDGHLWITGRKKNLIVSAAGKNIYPEQIEEKLLESNIIMESVIFGRVKKGKQGEEVCAVIVPDLDHLKAEHQIDPEKPDLEKIQHIFDSEIKRLNSEMAEHKRITSFEIQIDELEKTSTKKVKRFIYK